MSRWLPPDWSENGWEIDRLIGWIHLLIAALLVFWVTYLVVALWRFRASSNVPRRTAGGGWLFGTVVFVALCELFLLVVIEFPLWARRADHPEPANATVVRVLASQFAWNFHYPGDDGVFGETSPDRVDGMNPVGMDYDDPAADDDVVTVNQLHVPVDRPVLLYLNAKDVIHAFNVPFLRIKQDIIPGMTIKLSFTPRETGRAEIACAQLCGLGHYSMKGFLTIETAEEFREWFEEELLYQ